MRLPHTCPITAALWFIAAMALSTSASAHMDKEALHHAGFWNGFAHPLSGPDHLAAMLAVGLWSALTARRASAGLLWGPAGFAMLLLAGALLGLRGVAVPAVEPMIAASLLATGLLVATRLPLPGIAAALGAGLFAIFHGAAHGHELANAGGAWHTLSGLLMATLLLHGAGLAAGWALRQRAAWLARAAGAGVATLGGALLLRMA